jgi:transcriptional regulator with XRE-family HTH domain
LRTSQRLAQSRLAELAGCNRSYLADLEAGRYSNPTIGFLCQVFSPLDHEVIVRPIGRPPAEDEFRLCGQPSGEPVPEPV